jgi:hypothetical protein
LRWVLFLGTFEVLFPMNILQDLTYMKRKGKSFSKIRTFFKGTDQEVEIYHHSAGNQGRPYSSSVAFTGMNQEGI